MRIEWIGRHPGCIELLARWHHQEWGALYDDWTLDAATAELRDHATRTSLPTTLLLMEGDDLLGSVSLLIEDAPALQDRGSPWLGSLFVLPDARGQGGGRILVEAAVAHAAHQGVALLRLFTLWHEEFYASLGWQVEERTSLHGTPVVIMSIRPARRVAHTGSPSDAAWAMHD
ncbi:GNAT family N-acetyltransferase [Pseudoxanthomonas sp. SE1]|uniref:GNAT family N-acetyltransferase n=1 Tax=Pseudoxanthomonas sp. SE1 TaxID=1664560 RepID=UPI00240DFDEB|nr:GNAT family N-acetyltransferase [Pseudoxanthomonas sp. SE1]WFC41270.1 GNAT family N-acetyltransferase [Pseudoxanthomonas sp. SE1]